jgi:hypothetical protein
MTKRLLLALLIGVVATFAFIGLASVVDELGYEFLARALVWPNALLQSLVPPHNIGTPEHQVLEGSPLNFLAFVASLPLGFIVYGAVAFAMLGKAWRRNP